MAKIKAVYLRHKNRTWPSIIFRFDDGTQKAKPIHSDLAAAQEVLAAIRRKLSLGVLNLAEYFPENSPAVPLSLFMGKYLEHRGREVRLGRLSADTLNLDRQALLIFIKFAGDRPINAIDKESIGKFCEILLQSKNQYGRHYSPASINDYLRHLSSAFGWAVAGNLLPANPFFKFKKLPTERRLRVLLPEEINRLREYFAKKPSWQLDAFNLAIWTGIRVASIPAIKAENIRSIPVNGSTLNCLEVKEKGQKKRLVPLQDPAFDLLQSRAAAGQDQRRADAMIGTNNTTHHAEYMQRAKEGYLFFEVMDRKSVSKAFTRARRALQINASFHSTRHSFATYALEGGASLESISAILGHAETRTTQIYAQVTLAKLQSDLPKIKPV